jgi:starch phosphorylase
MPDHLFWSIRQHLKARMLQFVRARVRTQHFRNHGSEAHLDRLLKLADPANPNVLTIGFARRFATYKRATLLFDKLDWLREIVSDDARPVLFIFAGKAHPADEPGKDSSAASRRWRRCRSSRADPDGRGLRPAARARLVSGVDVWLTTRSSRSSLGTSGMKAASTA